MYKTIGLYVQIKKKLMNKHVFFFSHGRGKIFSCQGIRICINYFLKRGHSKITCFVPGWRRYRPRPQNPISDQELLVEFNEKGLLEFTPSRRIENKLISSYDDR